MWNAIASVTSGLTLLAFLAAVGAFVFRSRLLQQVRMIQSAKEADRVQLVQNALEVFHVDASKLTRQDQYRIAMEQIRLRAQRFKISAIVVTIFAFIGGGAAILSIAGDPRAAPGKDGRAIVWEQNLAHLRSGGFGWSSGSGGDATNREKMISRVSGLDTSTDPAFKKMVDHMLVTIRSAPATSDPSYNMVYTNDAQVEFNELESYVQRRVIEFGGRV